MLKFEDVVEICRPSLPLTEGQRVEAIAICDRILARCDQTKKELSEAIAGLKDAVDDAIAKLKRP